MSYSVITIDQINDPQDLETVDFLRFIAKQCREELANAGATRYAGSVSRTASNEFNVDSGKFSLFRTQFSDRLALTCYIGDRRGTASVSSSLENPNTVTSAVKDAAASALAAEPDPAWTVAPREESMIILKGNPVFDKDAMFFRLAEAVETINTRYPLIMIEQAVTSHAKDISLYFNSSGTEFVTVSGAYNVDFMYSAHDGDNGSSFVGNDFVLSSLDKPFLDLGLFAKTLENTEKQIYTVPYKGKRVGRLITGPSLTLDLIADALANVAEDDVILDGTSLWIDKIGKKVTDEQLTVTCTVSDPRVIGGQTFTDEGFPAKDYNIIDKGVLTNFNISTYTANKTGFRRAPNAGDNVIIANGTKSIEQMIKETPFGIYTVRFSGGEPSVNGDFSGVAKNSFLIENGKLTVPLAETMISGNLLDLLNNIVDISEEREENGVDLVPYMSFDGITISGE